MARAMKAVERAPAKINLTLAIKARRSDGYHRLESLVAFARDVHDELMFTPGEGLSLTVAGMTADETGPVEDNLVLKAARALLARRDGLRGGAFFLKKNLPVAAGLGGGSSDAAAALRLLARANDLSLEDKAVQEAARATGADVAVCLDPRVRVMRGIGDVIGPALDLFLPHVLLVNPRMACPTPAVFQALGMDKGADKKMPPRSDLDILRQWHKTGNDLQAAAIKTLPAIAAVIGALENCAGCSLARMSGSGATCFALFEDDMRCAAAEEDIRLHYPQWWVARTALG